MPKTSIKGYKRNSPDKDEPELLIPSNKISMKNVPHKVLGIDNFGYSQIMEPNFDYEFPGDYVIEKPIKRKLQKGGDKNKKPSERKPIITNDPKDPRLKAYNDSLNAYNLNHTGNLSDSEWLKALTAAQKIDRDKIAKPTLYPSESKKYKPVQPVVYQKPKPQPNPKSELKNQLEKDGQIPMMEQPFAENDYSGYDITPIETKPEVQTKKPEKSKYYIQSLDKDGKQKVKYFNSKKEKDDYDNKLSKDFYHSSKTDNSTQYTAILPEFQDGGTMKKNKLGVENSLWNNIRVKSGSGKKPTKEMPVKRKGGEYKQLGGDKENNINQKNQVNYFTPTNLYESVFNEGTPLNYINNTQTVSQNSSYIPPTFGTMADFFKTVPKPEPLKPSIVIKPLDVLPKKKPVHTNANINAITAGVTNIGLRRFIEARKNKEDIQNEAIASQIPTSPTINPQGTEKYGNPYVYQSGGIFDIFEQTPIDFSSFQNGIFDIFEQTPIDMSPISFPDVVEPSNNIPENSNKIENTTKDFIKKLEGFTPKAKWDYAQHSVGYGTKAKHKGEEITKEEAEKRLDEELSTITPIINKKLKVPVKQGQMTALISLAYNLGSGSSILKKVIDDINKGEDNNEIADYIRKKGLTGVGSNKIIPGLVNRRKKEATMFLSEYEQGGEYSLEDEDIQNLINQGYEIEYLD